MDQLSEHDLNHVVDHFVDHFFEPSFWKLCLEQLVDHCFAPGFVDTCWKKLCDHQRIKCKICLLVFGVVRCRFRRRHVCVYIFRCPCCREGFESLAASDTSVQKQGAAPPVNKRRRGRTTITYRCALQQERVTDGGARARRHAQTMMSYRSAL